MKKFSNAADLFKAVNSGETKEATIISGLVKPGEDSSVLMFSPTANCSLWIPIPNEIIQKDGIEFHESVTCKDHTHPYVSITLKLDGNPVYSVLGELLRFYHRAMVSQQRGSKKCGLTCQICKRKCDVRFDACQTACEVFSGPAFLECLQRCSESNDSCYDDC